jgi:hypothetical protein
MSPSTSTFSYDLTPTPALLPTDRDALWDFYRRHYAADRAALEASLGRADLVVRFRRASGALCGMLAFSLREAEHQGRRFHLVWAGANALDRDCRGKWLVERAALRVFLRFWLRHPRAELFLLGETCAFQSYRMVTRNFATYWPHPERPTPAWERAAMDAFAAHHAGPSWDPARRVIRPVGKHIRHESACTSADAADPLWRFFHACNPGSTDGEAMIFFAPISRANILTMIGRRLGGTLGDAAPLSIAAWRPWRRYIAQLLLHAVWQ